jgi:glycerophosphoryl diester phosphodiesterase
MKKAAVIGTHRYLIVYLWGAIVGSCMAGACPGEVLVVGHRGNSRFAPENTVSAFKSALGKADFVEMDCRATSDGSLVVLHDNVVDRTTDGTGVVESNTLSYLKSLDAGSWFSRAFIGERVPTLEEGITNCLPAAIPILHVYSGSATAYVASQTSW